MMDTQSIMSQSMTPSQFYSLHSGMSESMSQMSSALDALKSERLGVPNKLIIKEFEYTFKDSLRNHRFSYRCKKKGCGVLLTIDRKELDKLRFGGSSVINYYISKEHNCVDPDFQIDEQEDVLTERDLYNKGKASVLLAVDKPIAWHVKNVSDLGLPMTHEQIKNIVHYEREKKFPYDTQYLYNMSNITISPECISNLGYPDFQPAPEGETQKNIPFCYNMNKIINPDKQYREERYLIFTCVPLIRHFAGANEIYIDCNYKVVPKGYYQILTILSYNYETKTILPNFIIPMSHKSKNIYYYIFKSVWAMLYDNDLPFTDKNLKIYCEFEYSMRKAVRSIFPNAEIKGTYYYYIKRLWIKAKKLGICHKNYIEYSLPIIFALELIPFLKCEEIESYLNEIKQYIKELPESYSPSLQRYLKYYENSWAKSEFINFEKISEEEWNYRTNNNCNAYQLKLSNSIEYFFPKMATLVKKCKDIIKDYSIGAIMPEEFTQKSNTYEDIYLFVYDFHQKYKKRITFKSLQQLEPEFKTKMDKINLDDMKCFFGLQCVSGIENENDYSLNEYNYGEMEQIFSHKDIVSKKIEKMNDDKNLVEIIDIVNPVIKQNNEEIKNKENNEDKENMEEDDDNDNIPNMSKFEYLYSFENKMDEE